MLKCKIKLMVAQLNKSPPHAEAAHTVANARSGATTKTHMMGKVTPGGVQLGMTRSLNPVVASPFMALVRFGRVLRRGLKTRDFTLKPRNSMAVSVVVTTDGSFGRIAANESIAKSPLPMRPTWKGLVSKVR